MALTGLVSVLALIVTGAFGARHPLWWSAGAGLTFFGFLSASALRRYLTGEVVLAVLPNGLYDARLGTGPIGWEAIKELVLVQREAELSLAVHLWPRVVPLRPEGEPVPDHVIDLAPLDAEPGVIVEAIGRHHAVRLAR